MMESANSWTLTVTDLKQYTYCPRILYFMRCLPGVRPVTTKMREGSAAHDDAELREQRRLLRAYGFTTGERHFDVAIYSADLRINALLDLVIVEPDGKPIAVPVDYKMSDMAGAHVRLQLACYGLLVEAEMGLAAPYGFVYLTVERRAEKVPFSAALKHETRAALHEMRAIVEAELMPEPTARVARCVNCEFRRFCNDVL
jgi:CRISPR-associated exonuclease Cas4